MWNYDETYRDEGPQILVMCSIEENFERHLKREPVSFPQETVYCEEASVPFRNFVL